MSEEDLAEALTEAPAKKRRSEKNRKKAAKARRSLKGKKQAASSTTAKFPRHSVDKALRIPRAIIDQNAGHDCTDAESATFVGVGFNGPFKVEVSSSIKYGFLSRPGAGRIAVTERARQAIRPQKAGDDIEALRAAVLDAPEIKEVYTHYRGEYLPDEEFFEHALEDKFAIPADKLTEFKDIFLSSLQSAQLVEKKDGKFRILDTKGGSQEGATQIKKLSTTANVSASDSCFVLMPFGSPVGEYYSQIYEPAIRKAGLRPVRADADIFGTGKIIDQIWNGINSAKVLIAELTSRNPNVFYELGLAHALDKPVVLISSNEGDVPFDLKHIRVIYYNVSDPFWGEKLIEKVAENILSALTNPEEAVFKRALSSK
ncbi:hypothetical protein A5906_30545 [Bradyrhizobium sacchari]|uniref:Nucleoside 2-deoxyribosyltransferase-like protein n=1 Tax=Bradyrhizobium sacchari TaxID=1399419 RepID=A0A560JS59_9BRAD|nr:hypothetical protein [Bradyrhizobium sacchari]OPY98901.1 hypothetical protein A5906_30545 [Bradyrhizobium sacchari]TWB60384.1 hypothetical protein FBZ94_104609 [Bradyrhizobium sacchari]TWB73806.1 hypothetical protein FBZ95_10556 [Bradyrhizobium sacchari]